MALFLFTMVCLIWGSNFILLHRATSSFGPMTIGFWRLLLGGLVLLAFWLLSDRRPLARRDWPHLVVVGLLGNAIPFTLLPLVISRGFGHSFFAIVVAFVPLVTIPASICMLATWPSHRQTIGVLVGLVALCVLMWDGTARGMSLDTLGLAMTVPMVYAISNTYIRWKLPDAPVLLMTATFFLLGAAMLLPVVYLFEQTPIPKSAMTATATVPVWSLVWLGVGGTGLAGVAFVHLIQTHGPLFAGMAAYMVPILAMCWGAYDHEPISTRQLIAMAIVVGMVVLVQSQAKRNTP
jgi:drug/metabolite transporter (DMT)-like permease